VWVVFSGDAHLPWLPLLRPGFRHCWAVLHLPEGWLVLEALAGGMQVRLCPHSAVADLPGWYAGQGHVLAPARLAEPQGRPAPWGPFTCVELIKRLVGVRNRRVFTPWQLFRHLSAQSGGLPWAA
jgi:hypothetical protein